MDNFNRGGFGGRSSGGNRGGFGGGGGRGGFGGGRDRERPEMFRTTCDECGSSCEVPFRPTGDKPVFCSECFEEKGGRDRSDRGGRDRSDRGGRDRFEQREKVMYEVVCDECGEECEVPFKPTGDKPVFCSKCFEGKDNSRGSKGGPDYKAEFEQLNAKLDLIIKSLGIVEIKKEKVKIKLPKEETIEEAEAPIEEEIPAVEKPVKKAAKKKAE